MPGVGEILKYLKIFGQEWLEGSIRVDLDSAGRGVWADLLAMAQISRRVGYIERSEGLPYGDEELALRFKIPLELLQSVIAICKQEGRLRQLKDGTYFIFNWNKYQDIELGSSPTDAAAIKKAKGKAISRKGGVDSLPEESQEVKDIDIVYGEDGVIDENKSILFNSSLWNIRESLKGNRATLPANLERYRVALTKLGIPFEEVK